MPNTLCSARYRESFTSVLNEIKNEKEDYQQLRMRIIEELTIKKKEALEELRKRVDDYVPQHLKNDMHLYLRFLRARDFNLNAAESMLRNHLEWRKTNGIDRILTDFVPAKVIQKYIPITRIGFDKEGAPVRYFAFGDMDAKGLMKSAKRDDCIKYIIQGFEEDTDIMKEQSEKLGKPVDQWTYIYNFENYSVSKALHKPTLEALISLFMQYESNYPERLKAAYVINAPICFSLMFSVIKPLLSGATMKKITIFGKDGWKKELLKSIDPEVLPVFLGGNRRDADGDPTCKSFIIHGQWVPEEYYISKSTNRLSNQADVQKVTVSRKSKFNLYLDVAEPGSFIEWEFETADKDIGFGLSFKSSPNDSVTKELIPKQRIDTQLISEVGMYQCENSGTYVLVFDNTYSWIHEKEIYYKTSVVKPKVLKSQV